MTIVIITAPSGAGKTTLVEELVKDGNWCKPINYTTRKPRGETTIDLNGDFSNEEMSDYVFLSESQFLLKCAKCDLSNLNYYRGNYYGMSRFFDKKKNYIVVLEPKGRRDFSRWCRENGFSYQKIFIEVDKETVIKRLHKRGETEEFIKERLRDLTEFEPDETSIVVDGNRTLEEVLEEVRTIIN